MREHDPSDCFFTPLFLKPFKILTCESTALSRCNSKIVQKIKRRNMFRTFFTPQGDVRPNGLYNRPNRIFRTENKNGTVFRFIPFRDHKVYAACKGMYNLPSHCRTFNRIDLH